jgi:hypothetical protein
MVIVNTRGTQGFFKPKAPIDHGPQIMTDSGYKPLCPAMAVTPDEGKWWRGQLPGLRVDHSSRDATWADYEARLAAYCEA